MCVNDPTRIRIVPIMRKYYSDALAIVPIMSKKLLINYELDIVKAIHTLLSVGSKVETTKNNKTILLKAGIIEFKRQIKDKYISREESIAFSCETLLFCADRGCIIKSIIVTGGRIIWQFHITSSGNCS